MVKESVYYLKPEEITRLITFAPSLRDRVIIKILARTGMRRAELRDIDIEDIDFEKRRIHIKSGKGKKPRTVPVDIDTLQDIKFLIGSRKEGKLITTTKSGNKTVSLKQINEIVAKCGKLAGIKHPNPAKKNINPHLLRHSFARNARVKGMPIEILQQILGHKSIKTTIDVYGTPSMESVQSEYEKRIAEMYK